MGSEWAIHASIIADFVQRRAERTTTKYAKNAVSAFALFSPRLLHRGAIDTDLAACVPTIATWSLSNVPKFLPAEQIQWVLNSCDLASLRSIALPWPGGSRRSHCETPLPITSLWQPVAADPKPAPPQYFLLRDMDRPTTALKVAHSRTQTESPDASL